MTNRVRSIAALISAVDLPIVCKPVSKAVHVGDAFFMLLSILCKSRILQQYATQGKQYSPTKGSRKISLVRLPKKSSKSQVPGT